MMVCSKGEKENWLAGCLWSFSAPIIKWRTDSLLILVAAACYLKKSLKIPFQRIEMEKRRDCRRSTATPSTSAFQKALFVAVVVMCDLTHCSEYNREADVMIGGRESPFFPANLWNCLSLTTHLLPIQTLTSAPLTEPVTTLVSTPLAVFSAFVIKATSSTAWPTVEVSLHVSCC